LRRIPFRGAAATALALLVLLPSTAQPARAEVPRPGPGKLLELADIVLRGFLQRIPGGVETIEILSLVSETKSGIDQARDDIIANSEQWHTAYALSVMDSTLRESWKMEFPSDNTRAAYATRALEGARLAGRDIRAATTQPALDALGHALIVGNTAGSVAYSNLPYPPGLPRPYPSFHVDMRAFKADLEVLISKMKPVCSASNGVRPPDPGYNWARHECTAHDGTVTVAEEECTRVVLGTGCVEWRSRLDEGPGFRPWSTGRLRAQDLVTIEVEAMAKTSRPAAVEALALLTQMGF
jgi:hypothetical protein